MNRLAASMLAALLLLVSALVVTPAAMSDQQGQKDQNRLQLDIDQMTPRVVHSDDKQLTILGKITNTGDRQISDISARLQLGERQTSERQLDQSLADPPDSDALQSEFVDVTRTLQPGRSAPLSVTVPLDNPRGLQLNNAGVYPLLVNVNGTPEYGGPARLAALSTTLPVLGVPGAEAPYEPNKPSGPAKVSMLWPIADLKPSTVAAPYGGKIVLADDRLGAELGPGGRLDGLVNSAESALSKPGALGSMCFAIDPDLLTTVDAMSHGYKVRGQNGTVDGKGADDAKRWLGNLRRLVDGRCVVPIPFADADLSILSAVRADGGLVDAATAGARPIEDLLGVEPLQGALWPAGPLDEMAASAVKSAGITSVVMDADRLDTNRRLTGSTTIRGSGITAVPADSTMTTAFAGGPGRARTSSGTSTPIDEPGIATQDALSALAFRTRFSERANPDPILLAPPHGWNTSAQDLNQFVDAMSDFSEAGMIAPVSFQQLAAQPQGSVETSSTTRDLAQRSPREITETLDRVDARATEVQGAMTVDPTAQVEPAAVTEPVRRAVVRATSMAWQDNDNAMRASAENADQQLGDLLQRVRPTTPGQPLSLASGTSPLPVSISNSLPVAVSVRIKLINSSGLRPEPIPDQTIPANSSITQLVPAEALRVGRFNVDVALTTPEGTQLGTTARFELTSNDYGIVTVIVTATAAGALLLLSGRRVVRRIRPNKSR